ncbi:MAG: S9 family peptidase [Gammaproteobacteria bacterium]|nr:S9 family peptidase [Gammaproteobacteria bacterium]MYF01887.1 S9 family peptidase [Gammaproteobacteria bacterium]MYI77265.1 S9 family peptidase [Gammaproteobacteria bacterium]
MTKIASFGTWKSPFTAQIATAEYVSFGELFVDGTDLYFLELRPHEGGRTTLNIRTHEGSIHEVTPTPFDVRTKVHEYGGSSYTVANGLVYFVNAEDQDIYCIENWSNSLTRQITNSGNSERYANLIHDHKRNRLISVRETHERDQVLNNLVQIDLTNGMCSVLHNGHDFYGQPKLSPCSNRITFLAWDLPNMPWDSSLLYVVDLDDNGNICETSVVAGGTEESVFQPEWVDSHRLIFVSDRNGFWNLYEFDGNKTSAIVEDQAEYGFPLWVLDMRSYLTWGNNRVVAVRKSTEETSLVAIDCTTGKVDQINQDYCSYASLTRYRDGLVYIGGSTSRLASIVSIAEFNLGNNEAEHIVEPGKRPLNSGCISEAESISYRNERDQVVYANFYAPTNDQYTAPEGDRPPLLVLSHGGPTSYSNASFRFHVQYFTSRGWAVLDVNYGGSTGFGREYRNRLLNNWGIVDVEDCEAGVRHLAQMGRIDLNRVAIRGGSAGGYTTLRALTNSSIFKAGSSLYGVADVRALAQDTHKFESRYLDSLIPADEMDARSPINHIEKFSVPVIFYQGLEDRVVPPNQTESMYEALAQKGITTAMFLFEGEGHGFRAAEHVRTVLETELIFFSKVFGIERDDVDLSYFNSARLVNASW